LDIDPSEQDRAGLGSKQALDRAQRRCLAGPVRTEEAVDLTVIDLETDAVDGERRPVTDVQISNLERATKSRRGLQRATLRRRGRVLLGGMT